MCAQELRLRAQPVSPGVALGTLCRMPSEIKELRPWQSLESNLSHLIERVERQIGEQLKRHVAVDSEVALFEAHLELLKDRSLQTQIEQLLQEGASLDQALEKTLTIWQQRFQSSKSTLFRERWLDLQDVLLRLARAARDQARNWPDKVCLFSRLALPSCMVELPPERLQGLACSELSPASHLALLARARSIPCVCQVELPAEIERAPVIIDADEGWLILRPSETTLRHYRLKAQSSCKMSQDALAHLSKGSPLFWANIDSYHDLESIPTQGCQGIGLVRTEYLAYELGALPSMPAQAALYGQIVRSQKGREVTFRLFDFGSDKPLLSQSNRAEENPALGCRGIRFLLSQPTILRDQLRALLQASQEGPLSILVPMVCTQDEMVYTRHLLQTMAGELGIEPPPRLGMMVEVPAAALALEQFEGRSDFYSIGSNDLLQYLHAVDRNNRAVNGLYDPLSPALLKLIAMAVDEAKRQDKPITLCGEMAADPSCLIALQRLGLNRFSLHPHYLARGWESSSNDPVQRS